MEFASHQTRARPRFAPYALGRVGSQAASGNMATGGLDVAVPLIQRASFIGTIHPDYSNVELNQQTIAPTVFPRVYLEVRPFFVQGASFYNNLTTLYDTNAVTQNQPITTILYTPSIPTPRTGYAVEGYLGSLGFAAFDAIGYGRNDNAQAISWSNDQQTVTAAVQRVSVNYPGFTNTTVGGGLLLDNQRSGYAYATFARDQGTNVLNSSEAKWEEIGVAFRRPGTLLGFALREIGQYYQPADGYVSNTNIAGYTVVGHRFLTFGNTSRLLSVSGNATQT
jgi:hypothetical protein